MILRAQLVDILQLKESTVQLLEIVCNLRGGNTQGEKFDFAAVSDETSKDLIDDLLANGDVPDDLLPAANLGKITGA